MKSKLIKVITSSRLIYPKNRFYEDTKYIQKPKIQIEGNWLESIGFHIGDRLQVDYEEGSMEKLMYMMMIEKSKTYNKMTKQVVMEHVENIRKLDDEGKLEICGVFKGYPGMAGMYILKTESREEAEEICKAEPLVMGGYATYKLVGLQIANRENNYLL